VSNSSLVYSSGDGGDRRRHRAEKKQQTDLPQDGVVRIFRGKGGRGGKTMTVVRGLPRRDLEAVAKDLKRFCGAGGSAKDGAVEIQGDHREKVAARLAEQGYAVKIAGG
jgi:translation initiation factor 1